MSDSAPNGSEPTGTSKKIHEVVKTLVLRDTHASTDVSAFSEGVKKLKVSRKGGIGDSTSEESCVGVGTSFKPAGRVPGGHGEPEFFAPDWGRD